jgi:energy-coupling factor transporter ATP-binding protein EcfA2
MKMTDRNFLDRLGIPVEFPNFFPPQLEQYRRSLAEAADTPDEYGVAYMLAAGATAAGANVSACVQPGWYVRANLFVAVVGPKGSGKTPLRNKVLAPLVKHEEGLQEQAAVDFDDGEYEDDDEDGEGTAVRRRDAKPPEPCVIVNDCTGPAVLRLLEHNPRQLLANIDELSTMAIRNTGGTDRQMWCELYDGHRRRQQRASAGGLSVTLAAPYVSILGGIQPDLIKCLYGSRGDDGFVDRVLLVGDRSTREAEWPRDADDPVLNSAWAAAMERLLHMEQLATDVIGEQVEARFTPDAVEACRQLMRRLNELVAIIGVPEPQRGIVKKLVQHAVKLALLHRCFRWAAGEFGENAPLGDIDADDARATAAATLFFFGRWLIWRPELRVGEVALSSATVGLAGLPGADPALQTLAETATGALSGIRLIERLVRYLRSRNVGPVSMPALLATGVFTPAVVEELRDACQWLVDTGHGEWTGPHKGDFQLFEITKSTTKPRRRGRAGKAVLA